MLMIRETATYDLLEAQRLIYEEAEQLIEDFMYAEGKSVLAVWAMQQRLEGEKMFSSLGYNPRVVLLAAIRGISSGRTPRVTGRTIIDEAHRIVSRLVGKDIDPELRKLRLFQKAQSERAKRNRDRSEEAKTKWDRVREEDDALRKKHRRLSKTKRAQLLKDSEKLPESVNTIRQQLVGDRKTDS